MIVCICNKISCKDIKLTIKTKKVSSLQDLQDYLPIANKCRICTNCVNCILEKNVTSFNSKLNYSDYSVFVSSFFSYLTLMPKKIFY